MNKKYKVKDTDDYSSEYQSYHFDFKKLEIGVEPDLELEYVHTERLDKSKLRANKIGLNKSSII